MITTRAMVSLLAENIDNEESRSFDCPVCTKRKKMSITKQDGVILYNCYSAGCSERGVIGDTSIGKVDKKIRKLNTYTNELYPLNEEDIDYFFRRFHIDRPLDTDIVKTEANEYAFPLRDVMGRRIGIVVRQKSWAGDIRPPVTPPKDSYGSPKAMTYRSSHKPMAGYYSTGKKPDTVVVVEDCLSAIRCDYEVGDSMNVATVALGGTNISHDTARDIARLKGKEVVIALDEDATDVAFRLAKRWGLCFNSCRVAILDRDLKDTPRGEIAEVLGL